MIQNPLPRRNVHLRKRPAIRPRFLVLLVLSLAVLLASRLPLPSSPGKDIPQGTELAGQETESGPVGGDAEIPVKVGEYRVRRGDTLLGILSDAGVAEAQILSVARSRIDGINPSRIVAGRDYRLYTR
ncbi:MAG: LysM peptidoglycan-binding domain-containing protein, partial [bacterium]